MQAGPTTVNAAILLPVDVAIRLTCMRRAVLLHLLCVSLVAGNFSYCPDFQVGEPGGPSSKGDLSALPASSVPSPSGQGMLTRSAGGARTFLMRHKEGRSLCAAAVKAVGRVYPVARSSLPKLAADRFPELLWAHTCSVSLPHQHVRLQI